MEKIPFQSALKQIDRVDAPPYLLTRIRARMEQPLDDKLSGQWLWGAGFAFILLLVVNVFSIQAMRQSEVQDSTELLVEELNLNHSNQLYYD